MIALVLALLSGALFYLSTNLGEIWWLAWLAPVPVLWLAFGQDKPSSLAAASFAASALGALNLLNVYARVLPPPVLVLATCAPALIFMLCVLGARFVARRISPLVAVLAFAAFLTSGEYLASLSSEGAAASIAYSQISMPLMAQSANLFGMWSISFSLALFAAATALSLRQRAILPALIAIAAVALNVAYGLYSFSEPMGPALRVALIASDRVEPFASDADGALKNLRLQTPPLSQRGVKLIVLPEKISIVTPAWREAAARQLASAAQANGATLVAGLDDRSSGARFNSAWTYSPAGRPTGVYNKRHMVPGLESKFAPGSGPFVLPGAIGVEICKDMDYPRMLRSDAAVTQARVMAVPGWDFGGDGYLHARMAIMRSIENGFAQARSAREGLLTLNDAKGRVVGLRRSDAAPVVVLIGDLPVGTGPTLYDRIGDLFAYFCLGLALLCLGVAMRRRQ